MNTKYVCRALISLYENFHNSRTMWSTNLHVKICRWGGKGKRAVNSFKICAEDVTNPNNLPMNPVTVSDLLKHELKTSLFFRCY